MPGSHQILRACTIAVLPWAPWTVSAQDYPGLEIEAELAFQSEKTVGNRDRRKISDSFTQLEAGIGLSFTEALAARAILKFEPVRSTTSSRFLDDQGLWIEELYLDYQGEWGGLSAGKFNPRFGTAWDRLSDLFQKSFAADYERTEALGAGVTLKTGTADWGSHELGAALFRFDNTFLSNSAFARPKFGNDDTERVKRNRERFGGPGNTGGLDSFTVILEGGDFPGLDGLGYHLGHSRLARGVSEAKVERGYVGALRWAFDAGQGMTLTPLVELAHLRHAGGSAEHATYLTTALEVGWQDWRLVAARTSRHMDEPADGSGTFGYDYTDSLLSLLAAYTFDFGLEASVAWKRERVEGASLLQAIGFRLSYGLTF